ncbi:MAG: HAD family phosphatase [Lachnospiraceae bacterium]|nr:HAD family phosphatase [Lachnospiraceae bacterium]
MDKGIRNIVFDVGMVLIDFCWREHCMNLGFDDEVIEAFDVNMISSKYWDMMDEGTIREEDAFSEFLRAMPEYDKQLRQFWSQPEKFVQEYAYAAPMITELKQKGYRVYLLSNYPLEMYKLHWPGFAFYSLVDGYVVSAVEKIKKPDKAIYRLLCQRYALNPEECLFIDDRQVNVDAAVQMGMRGILFQGYEDLSAHLGLEIS